MSDVDTRRTVGARMVEDIDAPDVGPGCLMALSPHDPGGPIPGYLLTCPGCGQQSGLYLHPRDPGVPRWTVTAGDPSKAEGLTLSPSIHHAKTSHPMTTGCGWHGYLTAGVFRPC